MEWLVKSINEWRLIEQWELVGYGPEAPLPRQQSASRELTSLCASTALLIQQTNGKAANERDEQTHQLVFSLINWWREKWSCLISLSLTGNKTYNQLNRNVNWWKQFNGGCGKPFKKSTLHFSTKKNKWRWKKETNQLCGMKLVSWFLELL